MTLLLISLLTLIAGYFVYGMVAERVFGIDPNRPTPAVASPDELDCVPMPTWKVFLIQFLNIAGLGPIFGAIMGVAFGPAAFIWIVAGTLFAGGVHDFTAAMISLRSGGASLPEIIGRELGSTMKGVMRVFCIVLLLMVTAVFVVSPATIVSGLTPEGSAWSSPILWVGIIFGYYMVATLLPIDKVIGRFYPIFGLTLLFMALGILSVLLFSGIDIPVDVKSGFANRHPSGESMPIFPMMFVSIACGAISGFHATQSPMMARCLKNEKLARPVFYGAMVAEGIVALIWAAAAIAFTGGYDNLSEYLSAHGGGAGALVHDIFIDWLGVVGGVFAIIGVVAAPVTTGDTALRSARLMAADMLHMDQRPIGKRLLICVPLFAVTAFITVFAINPAKFAVVWRYFAWLNQTLAVVTLWACTVYLRRNHRPYFVTLIPAMFMTAVSLSFLLVAPAAQGGLGVFDGELLPIGLGFGGAFSLLLLAAFILKRKKQ